MKQRLLIFILIISFGVMNAQVKLSGIVRDAETGEELIGASVMIGENGTSTNESGYFIISDIKKGIVSIKLSCVGYETLLKEIEFTEDTKMNFNIYKKDIYSNQIVVTASRNEQMIGDVAGRVGLISAREINSTVKRSIDDVLKTSAAVHSDRSSGLFSHPSTVSIRGIAAGEQGRVLALIDGQPINKSDGGTVNWNRINTENVERIEIFKGPGSSVYGNNAMGGVVNIITKKASKEGYNAFGEVNYSTFNTVEEKLTISGKLQNAYGLYFRLSGFNRTSDGYNTYRELYRDAFSVNSDLKETAVDLKVGYDINERTNIQLTYNFFDDDRGQGTKVKENNIMKHKTNYGAFLFNTEFSNVKMNFNAFFQSEDYLRVMEKYKATETAISSYDLIYVDANRGDFGANLNFTIPISDNLLTAGVEFKRGKIDGSDVYRTTYDAISKQYKDGNDVLTNKGYMTTIAGFVYDEWKITNDFKVSAGLRFDNIKFSDGEYIVTNPSKNNEFLKPFNGQLKEYNWTSVTPKLSVQYAFIKNLKAYTAYSQGFRAATLDDLTRPGLIKLGFKNANPNLQPEKIESIEFGLNYDVNQSLYIMPSVYYMTGKDFMAYFNTGTTINVSGKNRPIIIKKNISKVRFIGGDIDVKYFLSARLSMFANFAITKTEILENASNAALVGKELTYTPNQLANFGITYLNEIANGTVNFHYQGKQYLNDDNSEKDALGNRMVIETNSTVDLKVWKKISNLFNASLEIQNVFDTQTLSTYDRYSLGRFITAGISVEL